MHVGSERESEDGGLNLKVMVVSLRKPLATDYKTSQCQIPEDSNLHSQTS
jgi:hypothetical protein